MEFDSPTKNSNEVLLLFSELSDLLSAGEEDYATISLSEKEPSLFFLSLKEDSHGAASQHTNAEKMVLCCSLILFVLLSVLFGCIFSAFLHSRRQIQPVEAGGKTKKKEREQEAQA